MDLEKCFCWARAVAVFNRLENRVLSPTLEGVVGDARSLFIQIVDQEDHD